MQSWHVTYLSLPVFQTIFCFLFTLTSHSPLIHLFFYSLCFMKFLFSLGHLIIDKNISRGFISNSIASLSYNLEQTSALYRSA